MASTNLNITDLDFDNIKTSIKGFLKTVTEFKDYDFDGSNLSNLIDILAYNTYYNGYYVNMVANEMFLDTALLRESILSRAKELNYVPRSAVAGSATVTLDIQVSGDPSSVTIPKGTTFTAESDGRTFTFATIRAFTALPFGTGYRATNVKLFEGELLSFTYQEHDETAPQKYVIPNDNVDINNLDVIVKNSASDNTTTRFTRAQTVLGVDTTSTVYYLEGYTGNQYRIVFGDGVFGRKIQTGNIVTVSYCATNGDEANGADVFTYTGGITDATSVTVTTISPVSGGAFEESNESIKFNAPRHYTTQNRAVTANDYRLILQTQFPALKSIKAYGGEEANPPQFGKVFLALRPSIGETLTEIEKSDILNFLKEKAVIGIKPEIIDPSYIYLELIYQVTFDPDKTTLTAGGITTKVANKIISFGETNLGKFNSTLRASKLAGEIDDLDPSILGSGGSISLTKRLVPTIGTENTFNIEFSNALRGSVDSNNPVVSSTFFTSNGRNGRIVDDGKGLLTFVSAGDGGVEEVVNPNVGTVDYLIGKVFINRLFINDFAGSYLKITAAPALFDINPVNNQILLIDSTDVRVVAIAERETANV
jgi:hypothetical protein